MDSVNYQHLEFLANTLISTNLIIRKLLLEMPVYLSVDIECYYLTKNVLMKIQENKSFSQLVQMCYKQSWKKKSNHILYWFVFYLEYLGTILEVDLHLKILGGVRETWKPMHLMYLHSFHRKLTSNSSMCV